MDRPSPRSTVFVVGFIVLFFPLAAITNALPGAAHLRASFKKQKQNRWPCFVDSLIK
jgi:hypothetical protein